MFIRNTGILLISAVMSVAASAATSEIKVDLRLDASDFVVGERVRGVVDIANSSPDKVSVGYSNSKDIFFIEVSKSSDGYNLDRIDKKPFTARFMVTSGQGQKLETFLADHYALIQPNRYLAKPGFGARRHALRRSAARLRYRRRGEGRFGDADVRQSPRTQPRFSIGVLVA